jgi:hypothetical protein
VLVDGSLRQALWYLKYFENLRETFPKLKLSILYIEASIENVLKRANSRALVTGRFVPEDLIIKTAEEIPHSLELLTPQVEFFARIINENEREPFLMECEMKRLKKGMVLTRQHSTSSATSVENDGILSTPSSPPTAFKFEKVWEMFICGDQYKYINSESGQEYLETTWKYVFQEVWDMSCEMPNLFGSPDKRRSRKFSQEIL